MPGHSSSERVSAIRSSVSPSPAWISARSVEIYISKNAASSVRYAIGMRKYALRSIIVSGRSRSDFP
eukprot:scaffold37252_cov63-Phaeocystis_antarctica.AAC.1